ncbi:MAG: hypothetical protein RL616_420 [Verrucomicrobiota bacterium]|jgi:hypothetical protein
MALTAVEFFALRKTRRRAERQATESFVRPKVSRLKVSAARSMSGRSATRLTDRYRPLQQPFSRSLTAQGLAANFSALAATRNLVGDRQSVR